MAVPAVLTTLDGTRRVLMQDLSARGARIRGDVPWRVGGIVLLQWSRFEAHGAFRWFVENEGGIRFFDAVPAADLLATRDLVECAQPVPERDLVRRTAEAFVVGRLRL